MDWLVAGPWWKPFGAQRALSPEHTNSAAEHIVEAVAALALRASVVHTALPVQGKAGVHLGGLACTCYCTGSAADEGFAQHIGSFACLHMLHSGLPELVVPQEPVVAVGHVAWPCPQSAAALEHQAQGSDSSSISTSSVVRKDQ